MSVIDNFCGFDVGTLCLCKCSLKQPCPRRINFLKKELQEYLKKVIYSVAIYTLRRVAEQFHSVARASTKLVSTALDSSRQQSLRTKNTFSLFP